MSYVLTLLGNPENLFAAAALPGAGPELPGFPPRSTRTSSRLRTLLLQGVPQLPGVVTYLHLTRLFHTQVLTQAARDSRGHYRIQKQRPAVPPSTLCRASRRRAGSTAVLFEWLTPFLIPQLQQG